MNRHPFPSSQAFSVTFFLTFCALVLYAVLSWLGQPVGRFSDWAVAMLGTWWLLGVVTIPWNIYFSGREVARQIAESRERGVSEVQAAPATVARITRWSLVAAVGIHLVSALLFAGLAYFEVSPVGWVGCVAAVALMFARPAARFYEHVMDLLRLTGERLRFPPDDVQAVRERLMELEGRAEMLNLGEPQSWASQLELRLQALEHGQRALGRRLDALVEDNDRAHEAIGREAARLGERVSEDVQFLGHVRELIGFIKRA